MNESGWVVIGTKLDTKQLERDLKASQRQLQQYEKEAERLTTAKVKADADLEPYREQMALIKETTDESLKYAQTQEQVESTLDDEKRHVDELNQKYAEQLSKISEINRKLEANTTNQALAKQNIENTASLLKQSEAYDNINEKVHSISNGLGNIVKKATRWILAVFSIRTAYTLVTRAMSTLTEYNDELANKLQSIRFVLASALEPVIMYIVNLLHTITAYIAYIYKAWFGIDLLSKSTAKSMKAGAGSAEKMRKSLAGFDEMNVLGDNVGASGGSAGGDIDLGSLKDVAIPGWIDWIAKNKDNVLNFLKLALGMIAGFKIAGFVGEMTKGKAAAALMGAGILTVVASVTSLIRNWDEMSTKEKIITAAFAAIGAAAIALGYAIQAGIDAATLGIGALIALAVTALTAIVNLMVKEYEEKDIVMDTAKAKEKLRDAQEKLTNAYLDYADKIDRAKEKEKELQQAEKDTGISSESVRKKIEEEGITYDKLNDAEKRVYKAYYENVAAQQAVENATDDLTDAKKEEIMASFDTMRTAAQESGEWGKYKEAVVDAMKSGKISTEEARDLMERAMKGMGTAAAVTFTEDIPDSIKEGINPTKYQTNWDIFKNFFNKGWTGIIDNFKAGWKGFMNWFGNNNKLSASATISASGGGGGKGMKTGGIALATGGIVKLASGAVVNRPGSGVPIKRNVYAGEAGAEGVIPLTDSQRMELLGEAIGRYITVNLTNVNEMNGRVISRELQRIQNENDFAYNR